MASASTAARLCLLACRRIPHASGPRLSRTTGVPSRTQFIAPRRHFSSTRPRPRNDDDDDAEDAGSVRQDADGNTRVVIDEDQELLTPHDFPILKEANEEITGYTAEELVELNRVAHNEGFEDMGQYVEDKMEKDQSIIRNEQAVADALEQDLKRKVDKYGFWYDGEDDEVLNPDKPDEFDGDDLPDFVHAKVQEVKEMRHYMRLAVWELPLLSQFAKPFELPGESTPLRWRYTTYFGDHHPAEKKVVVTFAPEDLGLTEIQTNKLIKLAGVRYDPNKGLVKMSCESYEHPAQNKRYLCDLVDSLIASAKDPADTFEDVPFDFRHSRQKKKPRFPQEWYLTEERKLQLAQKREQLLLEDREKAEQGLLVDGQKKVDEYLVGVMQQGKTEEKVVVGGRPRVGQLRAR